MDRKEQMKLYHKEWRQTPKGIKLNMINNWKQKGIIDDDLDAVYDYYIKETNCWICDNKFKNSKDRQLDHDHKTGEIRYICCRDCNSNLLRIPQTKPSKGNKSGYLGICYDEKQNRYKYEKVTNGNRYFRFFDTKEEAIAEKLKHENAKNF